MTRLTALLLLALPLPALAGPQDLASPESCWSHRFAARHVGASSEATLTALSVAPLPLASDQLGLADDDLVRLAVVASFDGARDHVVALASCSASGDALSCEAGDKAGGFVLSPSEAGVVMTVGDDGLAFEPSWHHALRAERTMALAPCPEPGVPAGT